MGQCVLKKKGQERETGWGRSKIEAKGRTRTWWRSEERVREEEGRVGWHGGQSGSL